jgi:hypothetical protein
MPFALTVSTVLPQHFTPKQASPQGTSSEQGKAHLEMQQRHWFSTSKQVLGDTRLHAMLVSQQQLVHEPKVLDLVTHSIHLQLAECAGANALREFAV